MKYIMMFCLVLATADVRAQNQQPISAFARTLAPPVTYDELCVYDTQFCGRLKRDGQFIPPQRLSLMIFQRFRSKILEIAQKFNVDPVLLMGVIVTEHTLNVDIKDVWESIAVDSGVAPDGSLAGIKFSYGFGQIYSDAAMNGETIVARIEGRPVKTLVEIGPRLDTMEGALTYAAGILVYTREIYSKYGFDISQQPGIMATLYNIGRVDENAQLAKKENRAPRVNFFGWFVLQNWATLYDTLDQKAEKLVISNDMLEQAKISNLGLLGGDFYPVFTITKTAPLYLRPERCMLNADGSPEGNGASQFSGVSAERIAHSNSGVGEFEILSQALDCKGKEWSLLRMLNGSVGWTSNYDLENNIVINYMHRMCKDESPAASCGQQIQKLDPRIEILNVNDDQSEIDISLVRYDKTKSVDYRYYSSNCLDENYRKKQAADSQTRTDLKTLLADTPEAQAQRFVDADPADVQRELNRWNADKVNHLEPTDQDIQAIRGLLQLKRQELLNLVGPTDWNEVQNEFQGLADLIDIYGSNPLDDDFYRFCRVLKTSRGDHRDCLVPNIGEIKDYLDGLDLRAAVSDSDFDFDGQNTKRKKLAILSESYWDVLQRSTRDIEFLTLTQLPVDQLLAKIPLACGPLFDKYPDVAVAYADYFKNFNAQRDSVFFANLRPEVAAIATLAKNCLAYGKYLKLWPVGSEPSVLPQDILDLQSLDVLRARSSSGYVDSYRPEEFRFLQPSDQTISATLRALVKLRLANDLDHAVQFFQKRMAGGFSFTEYNQCNYDPIGTSDVITAISALPCVKMVELPDEPVVIGRIGYLNAKAAGVVDLPTRGIFRVKMDPKCDFVGESKLAPPRGR